MTTLSLARLDLARLAQVTWLPAWRSEITRWSSAYAAQASAPPRSTWRVSFDQQSSGLGVQRWRRALPPPKQCEQAERAAVTRFLLAELNNHCWFALRQSTQPERAQSLVTLDGAWAPLVMRALDETSLSASLSPTMLYGAINFALAAPLYSSSNSEGIEGIEGEGIERLEDLAPTQPTRVLRASAECLRGAPSLGVDIGGTNIKLFSSTSISTSTSTSASINTASDERTTSLIPNWRTEQLTQIRARGLCDSLAEWIERALPQGRWPDCIGVSWPGPTLSGELRGSVTLDELFTSALNASGASPALIRERDALYAGTLSTLLTATLRARGFKGKLLSFRDAYCDAFGVAAASAQLASEVSSSEISSSEISALTSVATLTLGTSVAGFYISKNRALALDTYLCEYGRVIIDMHDSRSALHRSTGLRGTLRSCLGREGFARAQEDASEALLGEALAYTALELRDGLGVGLIYLSGGNATERSLIQARETLARVASLHSMTPPRLEYSPVTDALGCASLFTTALGASAAARAALEAHDTLKGEPGSSVDPSTHM